MESDREKIDKSEIRCIHFTTIFEFEYRYKYPMLIFLADTDIR
jgi:hypothetical protein